VHIGVVVIFDGCDLRFVDNPKVPKHEIGDQHLLV
jgi:hypothetical protein